jgi:hypothetical protein
MKVYISGPMTGIPEWNFPAFNMAAEDVKAMGHEAVNPADLNGENQDWHACLRNDIKHLCDCDAVVLLSGWENSQGAMLELQLAHRLGLKVFVSMAALSAADGPLQSNAAAR